MKGNVAVIGAGLVGAVAGLSLAHEGYNVTIFELRADPRLADTEDKNLRSINLAVSNRGIRTLRMIDPQMAERVLADVLPMKGRMIHDLKGNQAEQLYGLYGDAIYSIDRGVLNENLLHEIELFDEAKNEGSIQTKFEHKLVNMDFGNDNDEHSPVELTFRRKNSNDDVHLKFDMVIGADGAHSITRAFLGKKVRMDYSSQYIDKCYVELYIPPSDDPSNKFSISPNHLHIWPRVDFMLIALPNTDGSFTSTFFGPWKLTESLRTEEQISSFFSDQFPDAVNLIGEKSLVRAFQNNPKGSLLQVTCSPYHFKGKCIIIGDAAHSMVPFYGQGMNCGFEDVRVLTELLKKYKHVSEDAFEAFTETRHKDLLAILSLALANYHEMSAKVTSNLYKLRKATDGFLHKLLGDHWLPLYTMVSFRDDIPYHEALEIEANQHRLVSIFGGVTILSASVAILYGLKRGLKI